jgi:hypothetical protein
MSNFCLYTWEGTQFAFRHSASETFTFTMVKVTGTPSAPEDVISKTYAESTFIPLSKMGAANGVATLGADGKIPMSQLSDSVMEFKGSYDATSNLPALTDASGSQGDYYRAVGAGQHDFGSGVLDIKAGDALIHNGTKWELYDNTESVSSVNGKVGAVVLSTDDVAQGSTNKYYVTSIARSDLLSSSIASGDTLHAPTADAVYGALAQKSDVGHGHSIANVTGLQETLDGKSPVGHIHSIGDVTNLQSTLTGLQTQIDNKANVDHAHTAQNLAEWEGLAVTAGGLNKGTLVKCTWDGSAWGIIEATNATFAQCSGLLGMVVRIVSGTAYIAVSPTGVLTGFDSGVTAGDLFVGVNGAVTLTPPTEVGKCVRRVGLSLGNGAWKFDPGLAIEILS